VVPLIRAGRQPGPALAAVRALAGVVDRLLVWPRAHDANGLALVAAWPLVWVVPIDQPIDPWPRAIGQTPDWKR